MLSLLRRRCPSGCRLLASRSFCSRPPDNEKTSLSHVSTERGVKSRNDSGRDVESRPEDPRNRVVIKGGDVPSKEDWRDAIKQANERKGSVPRFSPYSWRSAALVVGMGAASIFMLQAYEWQNDRIRSRASSEIETMGKPKLGGPWTLVNARSGQLMTNKDLEGRYQLLYFGFTFCPDVCPQELEKQFGKEKIVPVFVSIDPQRDTCAQTASYCAEFHPRLLGLTGTKEMVKKITRAYRVYYNEGIRQDDDDYLVDHSIIHYLVDRDGKFVDFYGKNLTAAEMTEKISAVIARDDARDRKRAERRRKNRQGSVMDG